MLYEVFRHFVYRCVLKRFDRCSSASGVDSAAAGAQNRKTSSERRLMIRSTDTNTNVNGVAPGVCKLNVVTTRFSLFWSIEQAVTAAVAI